jgi:DNA polymerase-3 subunit epsilon
MLDKPLAIVDVETTGQSAVYGRIIEIAVIRVEHGSITQSFQSLVNPERYISPLIEGLTGITNADVAHAPVFADIAGKVRKLLDGAIFVAHNARFDYAFVKNEFRVLGRPFSARCLCTVKLSRKLFPQHRHHNLSSVIERHGISCDARHRAMGDAQVVYEFLRLIDEGEEKERVRSAVEEILKASSLPAGLDRRSFDDLPELPGVYLLYGADGELLYVGKSINIRDRVRSHFSGDHASAKEMEICRQVQRVEYRQTAGELGALLLESKLIKELRPIYNSMARRKRSLIVARSRTTRAGYLSIVMEEIDSIEPSRATSIMAVFRSLKQGNQFLADIAKSHRLCHRLLGLEQGRSYCFPYHLKQCGGACMGEEPPELYNLRLEEAFAERRVKAWPHNGGVVIEERQQETGEGEVFLVDNWCLVSSFTFSDLGYQQHIPGAHRFDYDSYKILSRYIFNRTNRRSIKHVSREQFDDLLARTT